MSALPPVIINIKVGDFYTQCEECHSPHLKATALGFACSNCGKFIPESKFISLMRHALKRHLERKEATR